MEVMSPVNVVRLPKRHEGGVQVGLPDSSYRAFEILYFGNIAAAGLAGLSKIFGVFVSWHRFVAPKLLEFAGPQFPQYVRAAGLLELALAAMIAAKPAAGGWAMAVWLWIGVIDTRS